jgi:hypothetical protein
MLAPYLFLADPVIPITRDIERVIMIASERSLVFYTGPVSTPGCVAFCLLDQDQSFFAQSSTRLWQSVDACLLTHPAVAVVVSCQASAARCWPHERASVTTPSHSRTRM